MIIRRSADRGHFNHGWLNTYHTFSFGEYRDQNWMGFRALRVINEDFVAPGEGFPPHSHRDMEILTFVLKGALSHKDSLGSGSTIRPGQLQGMRAGSGITHSEYNGSNTEEVHLLQIWLLPNQRGLAPAYAELPTADLKPNHWSLVASPDKGENRLHIASDAQLFIAPLAAGHTLAQPHTKYPYRWLHIATGEVTFNGETLKAGDAVAFEAHERFELAAKRESQVLLFDLA